MVRFLTGINSLLAGLVQGGTKRGAQLTQAQNMPPQGIKMKLKRQWQTELFQNCWKDP